MAIRRNACLVTSAALTRFSSSHSPHQPPARGREHYRERFDLGWDAWREQTFGRQRSAGLFPGSTVLSRRPDWVPAWDLLSEWDQAVAARFMECFAGFLSHADEQIGRVIDFLAELGERDNTIIVVVSDNGASAEGGAAGSINDVRLTNLDPASGEEMFARLAEIGGPLTHNNYPWGWTMAGNTPFRRWKREVNEGGTAGPCIISWPASAMERGGIRRQFTHAIDIVPTLAELLGIELPAEIEGIEQTALDGESFAGLLPKAGESAPALHETQYFEMFGSRAIYHKGWKAVAFHPVGRSTTTRIRMRRSTRMPGSSTTSRRISRSHETSRRTIRISSASSSSSGGTRPGGTRFSRSTIECSGPR